MPDIGDYKRFLPFVLEACVHSPVEPDFGPHVIARQLAEAGWPDWPVTERQAVSAFFLAAWNHVLGQPVDQVDCAPWFCALARLRIDVEAVMERWIRMEPGNPILHLAALIAHHFDELRSVRRAAYCGIWAGIDHAAIVRLIERLLDCGVESALEAACGRVDANHVWRLDIALTKIGMERHYH